MRFTKRLASLLLVAVMALALTIPALAAEHTYEIYQIFTGDVSGKTLSNVKWGQNGTGTKDESVADEVLKDLAKVADGTDAEKLAVITKYVDLNSAAFTTVKKDVTSTDKTVSATVKEPGYYLIKDKKGSQDSEGGFYTLYVVKVTNGTLTFTPKGDVPTVDKEILEKGKNDTTTEVKHNSASIGDTVKYEITGTLPSNIDAYQTYYYQFTDTLSKGLTYADGSLNVAINGVTVSADKYELNVSTYDKDKGTTITITINDLKSIEGVTINDKTEVVVTYSATLNENAVIAGNGNPNDVKLTYSNDPNHSGAGENNPKGETPKDEVVTYTTELTITKHDGDGNILPGAEFTLEGNGVNIVLVTEEVFTEDADGTYYKLKDGTYTKTAPAEGMQDKYDSTTKKYVKNTVFTLKGAGQTDTKVVGTVDSETGKLTFRGLGAGDYTLTESKTPAGYNTIDPISFKISFDAATKRFTTNKDTITVGTDNTLSTTIVNKAGVKLPETGGIGTTIFYTLGAVLVVGAGVLLVTKKRMDTEK